MAGNAFVGGLGTRLETNQCNSHALLQFRIVAGDTVLTEHLAHGSCNDMYKSSVVQNEIIGILLIRFARRSLKRRQ